MNKKAFSIIFGLLAVALGVAYTLAACGVIEPFTIFIPGWWTVFIIVPGLIMLFSSRSSKFVSLCLIALGVALFLHSNDLLGDIKKYIIPVLLIIFGLSLIIKVIVNSRKKKLQVSGNTRQMGISPHMRLPLAKLIRIFLVRLLRGVV